MEADNANDIDNAYQAPRSLDLGNDLTSSGSRRSSPWMRYGWVFVMLANMLFLGGFAAKSHLFVDNGPFGLMLAIFVVFMLGEWISWRGGRLGKALFVGGIVLALSQFLPVIQFYVGLFASRLGDYSGLAVLGPHPGLSRFPSVAAGFLVTIVAGGLLLVLGISLGLFLLVVTPTAWWAGLNSEEEIKPAARQPK